MASFSLKCAIDDLKCYNKLYTKVMQWNFCILKLAIICALRVAPWHVQSFENGRGSFLSTTGVAT